MCTREAQSSRLLKSGCSRKTSRAPLPMMMTSFAERDILMECPECQRLQRVQSATTPLRLCSRWPCCPARSGTHTQTNYRQGGRAVCSAAGAVHQAHRPCPDQCRREDLRCEKSLALAAASESRRLKRRTRPRAAPPSARKLLHQTVRDLCRSPRPSTRSSPLAQVKGASPSQKPRLFF